MALAGLMIDTGITGIAIWQAVAYPSVVTALLAVVYALVTVNAMRKRYFMVRSGYAKARSDLLQALRKLGPAERGQSSRVLWLNRDEHLIFRLRVTGIPGFKFTYLYRISEDDVGAVMREASGVVEADEFRTAPAGSCVWHHSATGRLAVGPDGTVTGDKIGFPLLIGLWRNIRIERTGVLYAGPEVIAEVTAQLAAAERLQRSDSPGE